MCISYEYELRRLLSQIRTNTFQTNSMQVTGTLTSHTDLGLRCIQINQHTQASMRTTCDMAMVNICSRLARNTR